MSRRKCALVIVIFLFIAAVAIVPLEHYWEENGHYWVNGIPFVLFDDDLVLPPPSESRPDRDDDGGRDGAPRDHRDPVISRLHTAARASIESKRDHDHQECRNASCALVLIALHPCTKPLDRPEWLNLEFFLTHGYFPTGRSAGKMFPGGVDYILVDPAPAAGDGAPRNGKIRLASWLADAGSSSARPHATTEMEEDRKDHDDLSIRHRSKSFLRSMGRLAPNVFIARTPQLHCDLASFGYVFSRLPRRWLESRYGRVITMNTGVRGPFWDESLRDVALRRHYGAPLPPTPQSTPADNDRASHSSSFSFSTRLANGSAAQRNSHSHRPLTTTWLDIVSDPRLALPHRSAFWRRVSESKSYRFSNIHIDDDEDGSTLRRDPLEHVIIVATFSTQFHFHAQSYFVSVSPLAARALIGKIWSQQRPVNKIACINLLEVRATTRMLAFGFVYASLRHQLTTEDDAVRRVALGGGGGGGNSGKSFNSEGNKGAKEEGRAGKRGPPDTSLDMLGQHDNDDAGGWSGVVVPYAIANNCNPYMCEDPDIPLTIFQKHGGVVWGWLNTTSREYPFVVNFTKLWKQKSAVAAKKTQYQHTTMTPRATNRGGGEGEGLGNSNDLRLRAHRGDGDGTSAGGRGVMTMDEEGRSIYKRMVASCRMPEGSR